MNKSPFAGRLIRYLRLPYSKLYIFSRLKEINGFYVDQQPKQRALPSILRTEGKQLYRYMDRIYTAVPVSKLSPDESAKMCDVRLDYFHKIVNERYNNGIYSNLLSFSVENQKASRVLDFGCGNGHFTNYINVKLSPEMLVGVDISNKAIEMASNFFPSMSWLKVDNKTELPFPTCNFDLIISGFVMHFNIDDDLLKELARVLKNDGYFVFNIYHRKYLQNNLLNKLEKAGFETERLPTKLYTSKNLIFRAKKRSF